MVPGASSAFGMFKMEHVLPPYSTTEGECRAWPSPRMIASFFLLVNKLHFLNNFSFKIFIALRYRKYFSKIIFTSAYDSMFFPMPCRRLFGPSHCSVGCRDLPVTVQCRCIRTHPRCFLQPFSSQPACLRGKPRSLLLLCAHMWLRRRAEGKQP